MRFVHCSWLAAPARACGAPSRSSRTGRAESRLACTRPLGRRAGRAEAWTPRAHMRIDVLTLFPAMFAGPLDESIIRRARDSGRLTLAIHNLRDCAHDRHRTVDDRPYGGGPEMLLKPDPIFEAV